MPKMGIVRTILSHWRKIFSLPDKSFTWLRNTDAVTDDNILPITSATYTPVILPSGAVFNRILDDSARVLYEPVIQKLFEFVPKTMAKKIARANVQQAFIFDTVFRYLSNYQQPKLLCVGSYEDTASIGLQKMGYTVDEIDPMINYFLQEFYTKPSVRKESYDIVFSTSVIEHDPNDQTFMKCIEGLLKPGGIAVITCDYKDGWKPGEPKPIEDARFYTKTDLTNRLLSYVPQSYLVDAPQWDCANPDFNYLGKYQYTFASFVIRKKTV
jgi:SAM-dependent methyltransferase